MNSISDFISISSSWKISLKCYYNEFYRNEKLETIIFLNSAFFNKNQWNRFIQQLNSKNKLKSKYQYITYDYSGTGESSYNNLPASIENFLLEYDAVRNWSKSQSIHLFGMSLGAWIGLNFFFLKPKNIITFTGYGNLAPYHEDYQEFLLKLRDIKESLNLLKSTKEERIKKSNWMRFFDFFYIPFFFPELKPIVKSNSRTIELFANTIFPFAEGNFIKHYKQIYDYLTTDIIKESYNLLNIIEKSSLKSQILLINGIMDPIANSNMSIDINKKINGSTLRLIENLQHGSILLGKGNNIIINEYINYLNLKY